jgi:hypothetical protein
MKKGDNGRKNQSKTIQIIFIEIPFFSHHALSWLPDPKSTRDFAFQRSHPLYDNLDLADLGRIIGRLWYYPCTLLSHACALYRFTVSDLRGRSISGKSACDRKVYGVGCAFIAGERLSF